MKPFFLILSLGIVFLGAAQLLRNLRHGSQKSKFNILIVSACSVRWDHIGANVPGFAKTPQIDRWAEGASIFSNAIAEKPWQNFSFDLLQIAPRKFFEREGYEVLGPPKDYTSYVPPVELIHKGEDWEWYWAEDSILHYQNDIAKIRSAVLEPRDQPFFLLAHLKYMHYPYWDSVNFTPEDLHSLSSPSRALLEKYRKNPERYLSKLPAIEVILNSFGLLKKIFRVSEVHSAAGIISDPARNRIWKKSPGFSEDLKLIKELYELKLRRFDGIAAEILNVFGDRDLADKTVVIFSGDHGEAFMEHGVLGHSVNLYDEMVRYPLIVKFPGHHSVTRIETPVNHRVMAEIVKEIAEGRVNAENFSERIRQIAPDVSVSRNCADTARSVRKNGNWKFIKKFGTGGDELYNLKSDPLERRNVIAKFPEKAWELEQQLMKYSEPLVTKTRAEIRAQVCEPSGI